MARARSVGGGAASGAGWGSGFLVALALLAALPFAVACQDPGFTTCGELICPEGSQCRGDVCVSDEQVAACAGLEEEAACEAELDGLCRGGYCQIDLCGNDMLDAYPRRGDEPCDGALGNLACADAGFDFGATTCTESCGRDTSACESFAWRRALTAVGAGRAVVVEGDGTFFLRGNALAWKRGSTWKQVPRLSNPLGDVVPLAADQALVASLRNGSSLGLWHYSGKNNELVDSALSLPVSAGVPWNGGVAMGVDRALLSVGNGLHLARRVAGPGNPSWTLTGVVLLGERCPASGSLMPRWAAGATSLYVSRGAELWNLTLTNSPLPTFTCDLVRTLDADVVAVGGRDGALTWALTRLGTVYDPETWAGRNVAPAALALDAAVAQEVEGALRLWASQGDSILVFEGGAWWRSRSGSTVLFDDLNGRFATHRPLAVEGAQVLAAQASQEAGLVQRNEREWLLGAVVSAGRSVVDVAVDDRDRVWALLDDLGTIGRIWNAGREGPVPAGPSFPLSSLALVDGSPHLGAGNGVWRLASTEDGFTVNRVGAVLLGVRDVFDGGDPLYAFSANGLNVKAPSFDGWANLFKAGEGTECIQPIRMAGAIVAGAPRLILLCRAQANQPRGYRLVIIDPSMSPIAPTFLDLPDHVYQQLAVGADGAAWLVSSPRVVRVAPPYAVATPLIVERLSPATGKLGELTEQLTDVVVAGDGVVYLSAGRQNLFAWDGARFLRVSSSQGTTAAYVALAARGAQLYAAHQTGVDLLLRDPLP